MRDLKKQIFLIIIIFLYNFTLPINGWAKTTENKTTNSKVLDDNRNPPITIVNPSPPKSIPSKIYATENNEPYTLTIMHTNDSHARVEQYPKLSTAIKETRAQKPNSLLLDAGDVFYGTLYFTKYWGQADLWYMNYLHYDAMTLGNHEFDKNSNVLADFIKGMTFPVVSSNVNVTNDSVLGPLYKGEISSDAMGGNIFPAIIKEVNGQKVGIFGVTTVYVPIPNKENVFQDPIKKANDTVASLKQLGINKIIAISHLGYDLDQKLATSVDGIDIIVGGHTHTALMSPLVIEKTEPTVIVQAGAWLKYLGVADVTFDSNGVVIAQNGKLLTVSNYAADPTSMAKLTEFKAPIDEINSKVVGNTSVTLDGATSTIRYKETNLGNLVTDAIAQKANQIVPNTTIALQNSGRMLSSINTGDITLGEVYNVLPYEDKIVTLDLTGEEIWKTLEYSVSKAESGETRFLQVSGLQFKYDPSKPAYQRVWAVNVKTANGYVPIDLKKSYSVATNEFIASGGDGFTILQDAKNQGRIHANLFIDYEAVTDYLAKYSSISPTIDGRIISENEPAPVKNVVVVEETDPQIKYSGYWNNAVSSKHSGGSAKNSNTSGAYAEYTFTGTGIKLLAYTNSSKGIANIYLDGTLAKTVDLYSSSTVYKVPIFEISNLVSGSHTIKIVATGQKSSASSGIGITLDALEITSPDTLQKTVTVEENDSQIKYNGYWNNSLSSNYSGGSAKNSSTLGGYAEYTFTGTGIKVIGYTNSSKGIADIYLDGTLVKTIDLYSRYSSYNVTMFDISNLVSGSHTIKIVVTGKKSSASSGNGVTLDAFEITI